MPFDTSASNAIDSLRASQSTADSIDETPVDLTSHIAASDKEAQASHDEMKGYADALKKGQTDYTKFDEASQRHQNAKFRHSFLSDYQKNATDQANSPGIASNATSPD